MTSKRWLALGVLVAGALLSLSCVTPCAPVPFISGPRQAPTLAPTVDISQEAASRFAEKTEGLANPEFRIELTEQEVTSYVALQLKDSLPLTSPQIRFHPGRIILEGDVTEPLRGHVVLSGTVSVIDGRPSAKIQEATIGGIAVPSAMLASLSDSVSELANGSGANIILQQIEVGEGRITLVGSNRTP